AVGPAAVPAVGQGRDRGRPAPRRRALPVAPGAARAARLLAGRLAGAVGVDPARLDRLGGLAAPAAELRPRPAQRRRPLPDVDAPHRDGLLPAAAGARLGA